MAAWAYLAAFENGVRILDASDPFYPVEAHVFDPGNVSDLLVAGHLAYLALGSDGIAIYDLSDPAAPVMVGSLPTTSARRLARRGPWLYVADLSGGLRIIDVSNPAAPIWISSFATPAQGAGSIRVNHVAVRGSSEGLGDTSQRPVAQSSR